MYPDPKPAVSSGELMRDPTGTGPAGISSQAFERTIRTAISSLVGSSEPFVATTLGSGL